MKKNPELVSLGKKIREYRLRAGFSQESLALELGMSRSFLGAVERGEKNITALNLIKLASALEVDVGLFFSGIT